jgi:hypothetical protein
MIRYALLKYNYQNPKPEGNLGDEIQSIAAQRFLPRIDYIINRDLLGGFSIKNILSQIKKNYSNPKLIINNVTSLFTNLFKIKKNTKIILNGWWMYNNSNWPPTKKIIPFFISFHISKNAKEKMLNKKALKYLKKFEPIGCRDYYTLSLLKEKNIKGYFSGCLTLTLKNKFNKKNNNIIFVDPFGPTENYIFPKPGEKKFRKELWEHFPEYIRKKSLFLSHAFYKKDPKLRFKKAQELLDMYAQAKLVITSRLHCALPCLAFGTPVIFFYKNKEDIRFKGLIELFNSYDLKELEKGKVKINWNNPKPNLVNITNLRKNLEIKCKKFINDN